MSQIKKEHAAFNLQVHMTDATNLACKPSPTWFIPCFSLCNAQLAPWSLQEFLEGDLLQAEEEEDVGDIVLGIVLAAEEQEEDANDVVAQRKQQSGGFDVRGSYTIHPWGVQTI